MPAQYLISANAFLFALASVALLYLLARWRGFGVESLVLFGIERLILLTLFQQLMQRGVFLQNAVIDYTEELIGARFVIENPNATSSCGCGTSFTLK